MRDEVRALVREQMDDSMALVDLEFQPMESGRPWPFGGRRASPDPGAEPSEKVAMESGRPWPLGGRRASPDPGAELSEKV